MKLRITVLMLFISMVTTIASAYDFMVDGVCYSFYGQEEVYVTSPNYSEPSYPQGSLNPNLVIPSTVVYNGITYKVKYIGQYAFNRCTDLITLTINEGIESISGDAFWGCTGLKKVTFPNSLTYIGQGVFKNCSSLTTVVMSSNIEKIEDWSFENCEKLASIDFPKSIRYIGVNSFENCISLARINAYFENPETVEVYKNDAFRMVPKNGTLHVVTGCKEAFEHTIPWSSFYNIKDDLTDYDGTEYDADYMKCDVNGDGEVTIADINKVIDAILSH